MEPPQEQDFDDLKQATVFIHSHSGKLRYLLAIWHTNHCPGAQFTSSYNLYNIYSGLYLRERRHKFHHRCLARTRDFADTGQWQ